MTSTLRPGLLVSLKSTVSGGVRYDRTDLAAPNPGADSAAEITRWETTKVVVDAAEFERATKIRGKCRSLISSVCAVSEFGLLCPTSREFDLARAVEEARRIAAEHNAAARVSRVEVYVMTGRIAQDDAEAARAISAEVRGLLAEMKDGIAAANPEAIREAARKAKNLGSMLTEDAAGKVESAIEAARKAARDLVRRVEKGGELAAVVVSECNVEAIESARFSFLDMDAAKPVEALPVSAPGLDLPASAESPTLVAPAATTPAFEF